MATCGASLVEYIITSGTGTTVNMTLSNGAGHSYIVGKWKTTKMENDQNVVNKAGSASYFQKLYKVLWQISQLI